MASLNDKVLDEGLDVLTAATKTLHICNAEPTNYTEATSTFTLGNKAGVVFSASADAAGGGREVTLTAFTDGSVTGTGTASHYAIVDTVNSLLLAAKTLTASQAVTSGNTFGFNAVKIKINDPA